MPVPPGYFIHPAGLSIRRTEAGSRRGRVGTNSWRASSGSVQIDVEIIPIRGDLDLQARSPGILILGGK